MFLKLFCICATVQIVFSQVRSPVDFQKKLFSYFENCDKTKFQLKIIDHLTSETS